MAILESTEKRSILVPPYKEYPKEATSGTLSRSVFFWLSSLFVNGYKHVLSLGDLFPLDKKLYSERLQNDMQLAWDKVPDQRRANALMYTWLRVHIWQIMAAVIPRLCLIGFTFAQPFLVTRAIELAGSPSTQPNNNVGYGLIGAYILVYVGIAVSNGQYEHRAYRAAVMMRGSIVPCIYRKTLLLDSSDVSPAAALTLISTDVENITPGVVLLHEVWAGMVEIGLTMYLLERQVGAACGVPIGFAIVVMIATVFLASGTGKGQAAWILASQQRIANTSKTLGNVKWLKLSGLNDVAFSIIHKLRIRELDISRKYRLFILVALALSACAPIISPVLTFIAFTGIALRDNNALTISIAFTSLSLFGLLNKPLSTIVVALPTIAGSAASFGRIQDYLNVKVREDKRVTGPQEATSSEERNQSLSPAHLAMNNEIELRGSPRSSRRCIDDEFIASVQGKYSWPEAAEPVIDITDWNIRRRTFTLLIGPVGCGKSTLLKCLLGELSGFEGTLRTSYLGVAYCDQIPWLPNETIRGLIIGNATFDEQWYREVISACALEQDLQNWPQGEESVVGSKGISLSGGQKHRLAIGRAVYSRRELVLFDDVFSGLDSTTEDEVFHNLLGREGLLRKANMTVVLASSDVRRAPYADHLVVLDQSGKNSEEGTFEAVNSRLGYASGLSWNNADWSHEGKPEPKRDSVLSSNPNSKALEGVLPKGETEADLLRRTGDTAVYNYYLKSAGWKAPTIFVISIAIYAFYLWLKWWADANNAMPNTNLGKWLGVYTTLGIGAIIGLLVAAWQLFIAIITKSGLYFHDVLIRTVSRAPLSFFASVDDGVTINRFSQDLQLIDMELPVAALGVAFSLAFAIAEAVLMSVASKYFAVVIPFVLIVFYILQRFYLRTSRQMRFLDIELKAPLYSQLLETLSGLPTIRAFQWERDAEEKNWRLLDDSQRPNYLLFCLQRWLVFSVDMVIAAMALILITITVTLREQIGPGYMGIALVNIMAFSGTMKAGLTFWVSLEVSIGAVARIKNFVAQTKPESFSQGPLEKPQKIWPDEGAIELRELSASYATSGTVLKNFSMSIKAGQKIGICGRTGSGKSSLALCLFRMLDVDHGSVTIDEVDVSSVPHDHVRSSLVSVPQEAYIFDGTVRLNVDPAESVQDDNIIQALEKVQLWPTIQRRGGLDAIIDDKFFSHGQSQLLSLARAMLRKSKVLVLDEATSSLDDDTSAIIKDVVRSWFADWTVIAIAHKLDSIMEFDRIAVLDDGQLVEFDEPKALLDRASMFRNLYEYSQTGVSKKMLPPQHVPSQRRISSIGTPLAGTSSAGPSTSVPVA
ncbi:MAG: hypothetical protein M1837_005155 [Sclerophora amabilis]|nr:MAG: hypothetical protein M1837_005155 [Sclerophora amabilis]